MSETKKPQKKVVTKDSSVEDKIVELYQQGRAPVDIARLLSVSVEKVLLETGNESLISVKSRGDLIDQREAGNEATVNREGVTFDLTYTKD